MTGGVLTVMTEELKPLDEKMGKTVAALKDDLSRLRAGRANPAILERIHIDYYGASTPMNQLANITVPDARMIVIQPWEQKLLKDMEKAILKSDIGINPNNDGKIIRLAFPPLTEERRRELTKVVRKSGEDAKVEIRAFRRDAIEACKLQKKNGLITEDDLKDMEKEVQELTDIYIAEIDKTVEMKDREILEV